MEIFDKIPSAKDVQDGIHEETKGAIDKFVMRISKALETMTESNVTISAGNDYNLFHWIHWEKIKKAFSDKWWDITYISEQRDGSYFRISMSNQLSSAQAQAYWNK